MSTVLELAIGDLVRQTMTRTRGREAAETLRNRATSAGASRVHLGMQADSLVTSSFVDELVRQAALMEREGLEIVFIVAGAEMLENFQKSVTWRGLSCHYQILGDPAVRILQPGTTSAKPPKPQVGSKAQIPSVP